MVYRNNCFPHLASKFDIRSLLSFDCLQDTKKTYFIHHAKVLIKAQYGLYFFIPSTQENCFDVSLFALERSHSQQRHSKDILLSPERLQGGRYLLHLPLPFALKQIPPVRAN